MPLPALPLILLACAPSDPPDAARDSAGDSGDSGDSADSGDTAPPPSSRLPVLDFGRNLTWITDDADQAAAYDAFAARVDVAEASLGSSQLTELQARNPAITTFNYQLDLTGCFHEQCGGSTPLDTTWDTLPESFFLHFSEPTRLRFKALDGSDLGAVDLAGCAEGTAPTAACRARTFIWGDTRYMLAVGDEALRDWMAARLLATTDDTVRGVFLDEHSHLFADAMKFGGQATVESGGGASGVRRAPAG